jgi:hypothetical protein
MSGCTVRLADCKMGSFNSMRKIQLHNGLLQNPETLEAYKAQGFKWIGHVPRNYYQSLRNPTCGHIVEISILAQVGSVLIDSPAGRKMIERLCFP